MVQDSAGSQPNSGTFLGVLEIVIKPPVEGVLEGCVYVYIYIYICICLNICIYAHMIYIYIYLF